MSNPIVKIEAKIKEVKEKRLENQPNGYELGMKLLFDTQEEILDLKNVSRGITKLEIQETLDHLATEVLQCGIDYFLSVKDQSSFSEASSLEVLNSARSITDTPQIIQRIEENIEGIHDWIKTQSFRFNQKKKYQFDRILLNTAFSFMTCDGHIHKKEIEAIRKMTKGNSMFSNINIEAELDTLIMGINAMGLEFFKDYFKMIESTELTQEQELQMVEMAINTLYADDRLDYNEKKFFKIFRSLLSISDRQIKDRCPIISDEFFERDVIPHAYLSQLFDDYFDKISIPSFRRLR